MSTIFEISYPGPLSELPRKHLIPVHSGCRIVFNNEEQARINLESKDERAQFEQYMSGEFNISVLTLGENVTVIPPGAIDQLPFLLDLI